jgi:SIR2-like domain
VHLRAQRSRRRVGLIFGSGSCANLGFPKWRQLVERIASHTDVDGTDLLTHFAGPDPSGLPVTRSLASLTQMLFGKYRQRKIDVPGLSTPLTFLQEQKIKTNWIEIIHECLYRDIEMASRTLKISEHPYLKSFLDIIKNSPLTVSYNFDDTLEKLLLDSRDGDEANRTRGYEAIDKPNAQFQKDDSVIYHPNGFLPMILGDGASSNIVFSDDAFQDQLVSAATGRYVHLSNHLFRNTCLLIGLSLDDVTLQSLLRQNAVSNPGNIHYIVQFRDSKIPTDDGGERIIFQANFNSYNLYTLFLNNDEIRDLAELISNEQHTFELNYASGDTKFVYYLIGSVGAGKSTAAKNFRSLITYDEWIDERIPELAVPEDTLTPEQKIKVNTWIAEQFRKKNFALMKRSEGIHLIDRSPLDPLSFGKVGERPTKAKALIEHITTGIVIELQPVILSF